MPRVLSAAALLLACVAAVMYAVRVPPVTPATAASSQFSAERAMGHVRAIAQRPHPVGSTEQGRVRAYLMSELLELGLSPQIQEATAIGTRYAEAGRVNNVLVRLPGTQAGGQAVLLMAHYDAVEAAPGAGDDASGSSVLLETLRALQNGTPLTHDVIALFADGEEAGLLGAAAFVREHAWAKDVGVTMNFEARGTRGPSLMFETGPGNLDVVRVLRRVRGVRATSLSTFVYRRLPNDTDLSELAVLERPAMNFAFIGGVDRYHTAQDDVAHLDARSVQAHGNQALALTRAFATGVLPRPQTSDAVFFDLPVIGLIAYAESWALPLALLALLPVIIALVLLRRGEPRTVRGVALGLIGTIVALFCGAFLGIGLAALLGRIHGVIGSGFPMLSGVYALATALLAYALAASVYSLLRRWAPAPPLQLGALVTWALISLAIAIAAPGISFMFTWPLIAVATAAVISLARPRAGMASLVIASAIAIFMILPTIYYMGSVALGLDGTGAAIIAAFTAFGGWLVAHTFELWPDRAWRTSAAAAVAAVVLFMVGAATVRTNDDHPVGSSFGYGVDADSGTTWLGASAGTEWARQMLWRELRGGATDTTKTPVWFARYFNARGVVPAPGVSGKIGTATVRVVSDSSLAHERRLVVQVRPAQGTRSISLRIDSGIVRSASIDGRVVDTSRYRYSQRGRWFMDYFAPADSGFTIAFTLVPGSRPALSLVSISAGIPVAAWNRLPKRPPGMIQIQRGDVTLVHQRLGL